MKATVVYSLYMISAGVFVCLLQQKHSPFDSKGLRLICPVYIASVEPMHSVAQG